LRITVKFCNSARELRNDNILQPQNRHCMETQWSFHASVHNVTMDSTDGFQFPAKTFIFFPLHLIQNDLHLTLNQWVHLAILQSKANGMWSYTCNTVYVKVNSVEVKPMSPYSPYLHSTSILTPHPPKKGKEARVFCIV
jgi:hypothetical protein